MHYLGSLIPAARGGESQPKVLAMIAMPPNSRDKCSPDEHHIGIVQKCRISLIQSLAGSSKYWCNTRDIRFVRGGGGGGGGTLHVAALRARTVSLSHKPLTDFFFFFF